MNMLAVILGTIGMIIATCLLLVSMHMFRLLGGCADWHHVKTSWAVFVGSSLLFIVSAITISFGIVVW